MAYVLYRYIYHSSKFLGRNQNRIYFVSPTVLRFRRVFYLILFLCVQHYGPVVGLRLGVTRCAVVQNDELIREVLITKADHFDSRPNFVRYHALFGGSKKNGKR